MVSAPALLTAALEAAGVATDDEVAADDATVVLVAVPLEAVATAAIADALLLVVAEAAADAVVPVVT